MRRHYRDELAELSHTYSRIVLQPSVLAEPSAWPALFIGSGGALPVAEYAAGLHLRWTGANARSVTPLEFLGSVWSQRTVVMVVTASGKHPDVAAVLDRARSLGYRRIQVVTCRSVDNLPAPLLASGVETVSLGAVDDGFLATNSVLAFCTAFAKVYGARLPDALPHLAEWTVPQVKDRILALAGPLHSPVTSDFETRMSEIGLAAVQATDLRNFAHGRHLGLHRNIDRTTVAVFSAPSYEALSRRTLDVLPAQADVVTVETDLDYPVSVLDLLVGSMRLVGAAGEAAGVDPGRPRVPSFGRQLYRLPARRLVDAVARGPVERKLEAAHAGERLRAFYDGAHDLWLERLCSAELGGVVLDFDGTCCETTDRFSALRKEVRDALSRLLDHGFHVGMASGRGRSLHELLRSSLAREHWARVHLGLYNGSQVLNLCDELDDYSPTEGPLEAAADLVDGLGLGLALTRRVSQITIEAAEDGITVDSVRGIVESALAGRPDLAVKVACSGHSVDLIAVDSSKRAVLARVEASTERACLAIGDQGALGGNDFELLASTPYSLSVDTCSPDPSRCWNLGPKGERGPALLVSYLSSLSLSTRGPYGRFRWRRTP